MNTNHCHDDRRHNASSEPDTAMHNGKNTFRCSTFLSGAAALQLASSCCFELGHHVNWYGYRERPGRLDSTSEMTTWLPTERVPCKFAKTDDRRTILEINDRFFYANHCLELAETCPPNVVFCGSYTHEADAQGRWHPRILVYDWFASDSDQQPPVSERYHRLRTDLARHLAGTIAVLQWVGHYHAAVTLLERDPGFGHSIEKVALVTDQPGDLVIPMTVDVRYRQEIKMFQAQ